MKKITSFVVLLAALLLTLPAQAFTWNWAEHETLSFLDMKKVTSRFVPINEATPVQMDAMEAPQSMLPVAKVTRRAAIASIDDIVGDYTWDYKTASTKVADPTTAEATAAQAHVTIAKGTTDGTIVISGMFPNDVKGSVDLSTGLISFEQSALGNFSQGGTDYGSYYFYAQFYNESDSKWYWDSNPVTATVGDDNVITFSNTQWIVRRLKDYSTGNSGLTPYYLPGSTLTPSEPLTPVTPSDPAIASAEEFSMTYYSSSTDTEPKSASVKVAVDGNDVYIQGFSSYLPEAWVKGTKDGNTVTFPKMQYMGEYAGYTSFFFYGGDAVFTYDSETSTYSATGQIFGVLGEQYYDGRYFNPVLTKVVEVAGTPATPSINSLKNSNYGWYFTFNIPLQDTNGNNMVASKVTYKIYTDVNHEVSLLTFTPTTHTRLTQDMSEFPYGFTDNYDFTATSIYLNDLFSTTWHQIGIQTIYTGGGETHESEIGWYKIKEYPVAKDIEVTPDPGTDISAAIATALGTEGDWAKNVTITLAEGGAYTISAPIKAGGNVVINGNGSTIDASAPAVEGGVNFIELQGSTEYAIKADGTTVSDHFKVGSVTIDGLTVKGLKKAIIRDTQKTYLKTLTINNSVIEASNAKPAIDFDGKGFVEQLNVTKSTIWAAASTNKNFTKYGSRPKNLWVKDGETDVPGPYTLQGITIESSNFVNIASTGQHFCNNSQKGTKENVYVVKNNIFVDCGKVPNQVIVGLNGGQASATPSWDVDGNVFNATVESVMTDQSAAEVSKAGKKNDEDIVKNSVAGVVVFKDAANGDFTLGDCAAKNAGIGDPRWLPAYSQSINIEQLVLDKTTKADIAAALAEKNIEISSNAGLDSLNDEKTLRNEPFLGLKIKAADATVKVLVKKGNALNVKFGCVNDPVNVAINGTPIDTQVAKNTEGSVFTLPAAEADQEVVFTTTAKNTVVLKQIMIGEDIAAVTLPAATKYQVSVAEGIVNGTVEFSATSMTDSKGYKTVKVGDEVTITATPAEGYELEAVSVTGVTSDIAVEVTDGKFTMPADAVTINATFKVSTGINAVKADALKDAQIYNLQGVRVDKAQKGLYIVNGRKVVIK